MDEGAGGLKSGDMKGDDGGCWRADGREAVSSR